METRNFPLKPGVPRLESNPAYLVVTVNAKVKHLISNQYPAKNHKSMVQLCGLGMKIDPRCDFRNIL